MTLTENLTLLHNAQACVHRAVDGPQLKNDDSVGLNDLAVTLRDCGLNDLAVTLRDCLLTLSDLGEQSEINNYPTLIGVEKRLPYKLRESWKRKVATIIEESDREHTFEHLVEFVERESKIKISAFSKRMDEEFQPQKGKHDVSTVK